MKHDTLLRAWVALIGLSALSTMMAILIDRGGSPMQSGRITIIAGVVILGLSLIKARIILSRYLGLQSTDFWRRGFNAALTAFSLVLLGLYLAPLL